MILESLALAMLLRVDPAGDAHGAGDLSPPTAAVFSSSAPFDLTEVAVLEDDVLSLRVRLADRSNPGSLPNGITLPVIDLYLDTDEGGEVELLPGPGLRMPDGSGWNVALRVTGDRAYAVRAGDVAVQHAVTVRPADDALILATPFASPERAPVVHAMTGVYDPFGGAGEWRPLTRDPSPWSFSSPEAVHPVVDLLALDDAAQRAALGTGVLPARPTRDGAVPWVVLMVGGLALAVAGLLLRAVVGRGAAGAGEEGTGRTWSPLEVPAADPGEAPGPTADGGAYGGTGQDAGAEPGAGAEPPLSPDPTAVAVETAPPDPADGGRADTTEAEAPVGGDRGETEADGADEPPAGARGSAGRAEREARGGPVSWPAGEDWSDVATEPEDGFAAYAPGRRAEPGADATRAPEGRDGSAEDAASHAPEVPRTPDASDGLGAEDLVALLDDDLFDVGGAERTSSESDSERPVRSDGERDG